MYTRTDETLINIISYGQQDLGMPPFAKAFGGVLGPSDIQAIVTFMRYTWDDRVELPQEVVAANAIPTLAPGEVPSYEVHMSAIQRRYCVSCHREGKKNNNYLMDNYEDTINTGDHAPNLIEGDLNCNTMQMLNRVEGLEAGNPMPPTRALPPALVAIYQAWIMAGMPNSATDAAALTAPPPGAITPAILLQILLEPRNLLWYQQGNQPPHPDEPRARGLNHRALFDSSCAKIACMPGSPGRFLPVSLLLIILILVGVQDTKAETAYTAVLSTPDTSDFPYLTAYLDVHDPEGVFFAWSYAARCDLVGK